MDNKKSKNNKEMVAISYAWVNDEYKEKIIGFANFLRDNGYNAIMDEFIKQEYTAIDLNEMMIRMISVANKVIVVLSQKYKHKADKFEGGVGSEYRIIVNDINEKPRKYIMITFDSLKEVSAAELLPSGFGNREIIDMNEDNAFQVLFSKLSDNLLYSIRPIAREKTVPMQRELVFGVNSKKKETLKKIKILLMENKQLLIQYGPNSLVARNNPLSDVANIWNYKKKMTIIPNNREIIKVFESSINLFDDEEIAIFEKFKAHAEAFEMNQVYRMDSDATIQFPAEFERMIYREVDKND